MERLTEHIENNKIHLKDLDKGLVKLAEFEDFMEEHNLTLEQLKVIIEWLLELNGNDFQQIDFICQGRAKIFESNKQLKQENQALKDRWDKLKEWIDYCSSGCLDYEEILQKMQELEKE